MVGLVMAFLLVQTATDEISCKWLLTAMGTALAGTNVFWAMWVKSLLSEAKTLNAERTQDLKDIIRAREED